MASGWSEVCRLLLGREQAWRLSTNVPDTPTGSAKTLPLSFRGGVTNPQPTLLAEFAGCYARAMRHGEHFRMQGCAAGSRTGRSAQRPPTNIGGDYLQWSSWKARNVAHLTCSPCAEFVARITRLKGQRLTIVELLGGSCLLLGIRF